MNESNRFFGGRERGVVTVFTAIIFLVAITLVVIFVAQTGILEQRMSANEIRMKQTAIAAQGGVERAMAYMQKNNTPTMFDSNNDGNEQAYRAMFLSLDAAREPFGGIDDVCPPLPEQFPTEATQNGSFSVDNLREAVILSCGWSDDRSARKAIMVSMEAGPALASEATAPLTAVGMLDIRGNVNVYNAYRRELIRTFEVPEITGGAAELHTRRSETPPPPVTDPVPRPDDPIYDDVRSVRGDDNETAEDEISIFTDPALRNENDDFFERFMGLNKTAYRDTMVAHEIEGQGNSAISIEPDRWGQVIWVEGNARLDESVGTRDNPVVLVVNGDLTTRGNFDEFHGILYVVGNIEARGNPEFYGSVIVEGAVEDSEVSGTPRFVFDPLAANRAANSGIRAQVSGSWRDWVSN